MSDKLKSLEEKITLNIQKPEKEVGIKIKTLEEKYNDKLLNYTIDHNKRTLDEIYQRQNSDLDFLSEDLPTDKNREKILSINYSPKYHSSSNRIETRKKHIFNINNGIYNKRINEQSSNKESVIKPMNEFKELENNNYANLFEFSSKLNREENKKSFFKKQNINKSTFDNDFGDDFVDDENFNCKNIVFPINQKKNFNVGLYEESDDSISQGIKSIKNTINNNNNNYSNINDNNNYNNNDYNYNYKVYNNNNINDYFFELYRDFSNQNKNLQVLGNKITKINNKQKKLYGNQRDSPKPNTLLNNMKMHSPIIKRTNNKINISNINDLLDKIGLNKKNVNSGNLYDNKRRDYYLKDIKQKPKYMDNLKGELKQYNISKDIKLNKNPDFNEIDEKIEKMLKMKRSYVNINNKNNINDNKFENIIESSYIDNKNIPQKEEK